MLAAVLLDQAGLPVCSIAEMERRCQAGEFSVPQAEVWCKCWNADSSHQRLGLFVRVNQYTDGSFDTLSLHDASTRQTNWSGREAMPGDL